MPAYRCRLGRALSLRAGRGNPDPLTAHSAITRRIDCQDGLSLLQHTRADPEAAALPDGPRSRLWKANAVVVCSSPFEVENANKYLIIRK